jgi:hypothetical protein
MTEQEWKEGPAPALIEHVRKTKSEDHFFRMDMGRKHALCATALARQYWKLFNAEAREVIDCIEESRPGPNMNHLDISINEEIERMLDRVERHKPKSPDAYSYSCS